MRVAIQGEFGSFSDEAARTFLPGCSVVPCVTSSDVFDTVDSGRAASALVPIENSLAGPVAQHLDLLLARAVFIQREFPLRIRHNLIAAPGVKLKDVRRVFSHPVALEQCRDFFRRHRQARAESFYDTAGSVRHVVAENLRDAAAIAGSRAAAKDEKGGTKEDKAKKAADDKKAKADEKAAKKKAIVALARATSARWIMSTFWRTLSITMPNLPSRYQTVKMDATSMKNPIRMMIGVCERLKAGCTSLRTM